MMRTDPGRRVAQIELLPSHEPLEMHDMPEAMEMEKEPSEEVRLCAPLFGSPVCRVASLNERAASEQVTFEYGLKEGDYVKLVMLSGCVSSALQRCKSCESLGVFSGRSLTGPFRDPRRFPSTGL
jgi:hypothetical protein